MHTEIALEVWGYPYIPFHQIEEWFNGPAYERVVFGISLLYVFKRVPGGKSWSHQQQRSATQLPEPISCPSLPPHLEEAISRHISLLRRPTSPGTGSRSC